MKKIIQLVIFLILIILIFAFYTTYFISKDDQIDLIKKDNKTLVKNENNLIKNLKYEIKIDNDSQYNLSSELSEVTFIDEVEIIKMKKVRALLINKNSFPLTIYSDDANYNINTHMTSFVNNVKVQYLNNTIYSEKINLDIDKNTIHISNKVKYVGDLGIINSDNIKINLITRKIDIYMNENTNSNVKISPKN